MSAIAGVHRGLAAIRELYRNRSLRARDLRSQGRKVVGYYCCYVPIELLTALDLVPYRIMGNVRAPIDQADAHLETVMCPFIRSTFDIALKGGYDFLDGLVVPHSCDTVQRLYDIWRYFIKTPYTHYINVPHMVHGTSRGFFKAELTTFKRSLEKLAGRELSKQNLRHAVELHNEIRGSLRKLYGFRKQDPPLISGTEMVQIVVAGMAIPAEEYCGLLRSVVDEVAQRKDGLQRKSARVLLYGSEVDDTALVELVEECGANVVMDDLCSGTRQFWHDVEVTEDPLDGLAERYLCKVVCPRTYRGYAGSREPDLENRFNYLIRYAQDFAVNAAILYIIRFCDTHELEAPDVRDYLEQKGLPVLYIEDDYSVTTIGQLRTRIQAFLEMIG